MGNLVIPQGHAQVMFRFELAGDPEPMGFTMGVASDDGDTAADVVAVVDAVEFAWKSTFANTGAQLLAAYTYRGVVATCNGSDAGIFPHEVVRSTGGTGSGTPPPQNCGVLVKKRTLFGGKRNRGRLYMPPINLDEGTVGPSGDLTSAYTTGQQTGWDTFHTSFTGGLQRIVILHRQETGDPPPPAPTTVTGFTVQTKIGTQRRRLRR